MSKNTPKKKKKKPARAGYITLSRRKACEWLFAFFVVCGCMFVIGVLVGRNTAPVRFDVNRIENKLANIRESVLQKKKQIKKSAQEYLPEIEKIDVIDKLKEKGKKPKIYKQFIPPVKTPKYGKTAVPAGLPDRAETGRAPQPGKKSETPEPAEKEREGVYAIQVAALRNPAKAKTIADRFREKGYPAYCRASDIKGEKWFRVRIGPYPDRATVEKDCVRLREAGVKPVVYMLER